MTISFLWRIKLRSFRQSDLIIHTISNQAIRISYFWRIIFIRFTNTMISLMKLNSSDDSIDFHSKSKIRALFLLINCTTTTTWILPPHAQRIVKVKWRRARWIREISPQFTVRSTRFRPRHVEMIKRRRAFIGADSPRFYQRPRSSTSGLLIDALPNIIR